MRGSTDVCTWPPLLQGGHACTTRRRQSRCSRKLERLQRGASFDDRRKAQDLGARFAVARDEGRKARDHILKNRS